MTTLTRYPPERQRAIADFLLAQEDRRATVTQISEHLEVTTETVRRDLDTLERRGLLRRVRGGAQLLDAVPFEVALAARHAEQHEDKRRIAARLAEELPHDGVLVLDSGSLTLFVAQAVPRDAVLTVVTNNLPAARHLADHPGVQVITLPGMVRTSRRLQSLTVDVAVVGVNGMTAAQGLTTTNPEEASAKRAMLLSARRRIVPVISGKLGRNSFCSFAAVSELDLVLTDAAAPDPIIAELSAAGPEVVVVG